MTTGLQKLLFVIALCSTILNAGDWLDETSVWYKKKIYALDCFLSGTKNDGKLSYGSSAELSFFLRHNTIKPDYSISARIKIKKLSEKLKLIISTNKRDNKRNLTDTRINPESKPMVALQYKEKISKKFYYETRVGIAIDNKESIYVKSGIGEKLTANNLIIKADSFVYFYILNQKLSWQSSLSFVKKIASDTAIYQSNTYGITKDDSQFIQEIGIRKTFQNKKFFHYAISFIDTNINSAEQLAEYRHFFKKHVFWYMEASKKLHKSAIGKIGIGLLL